MSRAPRVLLLSDTETLGGAGIAASRLARALARQGCRVTRAVLFPDPESPRHWERVVLAASGVRPVDWSRVPHEAAEPLVLEALRDVLDASRPDWVGVHNLHGGLKAGWSVEMAGLCAERAPTLWTLHDMWSFTGKCIYAGECSGYARAEVRRTTSCGEGACPDQGRYPDWRADALAGEFDRKLRVVREHPALLAVAPSHWMAERARAGLWGEKVRVIPNGLDLKRFRPVPAPEARRALGLDAEGPVLLACAANLADPRKGAALLEQALRRGVEQAGRGGLPGGAALLLMGDNPGIVAPAPWRTRSLGFVRDPARRALAYAAADVFVHAALEDNLPNTVAEALACGTPVAAFASGGVPEMVRHGENGFLAKAGDVAGLFRAIRAVLDAEGGPLRVASRRTAEALFDPERCARAYRELAGALAS